MHQASEGQRMMLTKLSCTWQSSRDDRQTLVAIKIQTRLIKLGL